MSKSVQLSQIIISGFIVIFATSFLLDIPIIQDNIIRKILVYFLVCLEFVFFILLGNQIALSKNKQNK